MTLTLSTMQRRMLTIVQFMRPFTLLAPGIGFASAGLMSIGRAQAHLGWRMVLVFAIGSLAAATLNAASNGLNQVFDLEIDRINKPQRPLPAGKMRPDQGLIISVGLYFVSLVLALFLTPTSFIMFVLAALATVLYSVPPIRTKARGWWANLSIAIPRGVLLVVSGWAVIRDPFSPEPWFLGLVFGLFVFGAATTKDLADIEGDRLHHCATLPVMYGPARATQLIAPFFVLPWLLLPFGAALGILEINATWAALVGVGLAIWGVIIVRIMYRSAVAAPTQDNQRAWLQMYLMLLAAQAALAALYVLR